MTHQRLAGVLEQALQALEVVRSDHQVILKVGRSDQRKASAGRWGLGVTRQHRGSKH